MVRLFKLVMAAYGFMAFSGCASIVSGTTQPITVTSSPEGANVKAEPGGFKTTTPGKLELKRSGGPYKITFSLDNYEPYSALLTTETNGWVWGNLLFGGLIGALIDGSTGAGTKLSPDTLKVNLVKTKPTPSASVDKPLENQETVTTQPVGQNTHR